jgi:hypothetical protein
MLRFKLYLDRDTSFLEYAVQEGFIEYITTELSEKATVRESRNILFESAAINPLSRYNCNLREYYEVNLIPMMQLFVKYGANPNQQQYGENRTICERCFMTYQGFLEDFLETKIYHEDPEDSEKRDLEMKYARQKPRILLSAGADTSKAGELLYKVLNTGVKRYSQRFAEEILQLTELLFSHGVDPNIELSTQKTLWTQTLEMFFNSKSSDRSQPLLELFLDVIKPFLLWC